MPYRFTPISSRAKLQDALRQINQNFMMLDAEASTRIVNQGNGVPAIITGRLPNNRYGILIHDTNGIPKILIGQAPDTGEPDIWINTTGGNVLKDGGISLSSRL
jgi:hypothetical protein